MSDSENSPSPSASRPLCLITGGSSGVGLATALRFAKENHDVLICARDQVKLEQAQKQIVAEGVRCETIPFDLDKNAANAGTIAQRAIGLFGRIDILVNNAALAPLSPLVEMDPAHFESTLNVNHRAVFYMTREVWRQMQKQDSGGTIVNISSLAALDPFPGFSIYGASKAWIDLMTRALGAEGQDQNIHVFSIRPGAVETPLLRSLFPDFPADQAVDPGEVADQVWNVCQDSMKAQSGQAFNVSNQTDV